MWIRRVADRRKLNECGKELHNLLCSMSDYYRQCLEQWNGLDLEPNQQEAYENLARLILNFFDEKGDNNIDEFMEIISASEGRPNFEDLDNLSLANDTINVCRDKMVKVLESKSGLKGTNSGRKIIRSTFADFVKVLSVADGEMRSLVGFYKKV